VRVPCCNESGHVSNFSDPEFLPTIMRDLTKLRYAIRKSFQPATVIDSLKLIRGGNYSIEKADQVISAGWALDPVHPTKHIYAKAALNLIEKMASCNRLPSSGQTGGRKRTWSASIRNDQDGGTQGGDGRGGGQGKSNRSTSISRQWPEVRRNGGSDGYSVGGYTGGRYSSGGYSGGGYADNRPHLDGRYGTTRRDGGHGRRRFHQENPRHGGGTSGGTGDRSWRGNAGGSGSGSGSGGRGGAGREVPILLLGIVPPPTGLLLQ